MSPDALVRHAQILKANGFKLTTVTEAARSQGRVAALSFDDGFADNLQVGAPALASVGAVGTVYVIASAPDERSGAFDRRLTDDEVLQLSAAGWEIGSHTATHPRLSECSEVQQREEIAGSKKRLEDLVGKAVTSLAYPFGAYSDTTLRLAKEAGYENAVTTSKFGGGDSAFNILRVSLGGYGFRAWKQTMRLRWHLLLKGGRS